MYKKKVLQIFCVTNECDSDLEKLFYLLKQMVTKKCVTQTKMWLKWHDYKRGLLYLHKIKDAIPRVAIYTLRGWVQNEIKI
jgi:hypothetical protein